MPKKTYTRILATIGPSSADERTISALLDAGADAFRFNFSHGTREEHKQRYDIVRRLRKKRDCLPPSLPICRGRNSASVRLLPAAWF